MPALIDNSLSEPSDKPLSVLAVPAFNDNYLWLIHDGRHAAVVDPGDAQPILAALDANGLMTDAVMKRIATLEHVTALNLGGSRDDGRREARQDEVHDRGSAISKHRVLAAERPFSRSR